MLWIETALACGGFACSGPTPVVQTAERIAFVIEPEGYVETHVQVFYEGPPDAFAWVVPIPAEPEVFLSNDALFTQIDQLSAPVFAARTEEIGCFQPVAAGGGGCKGDAADPVDEDVVEEPSVTLPVVPDVLVTSQGQTGPYDYVVLQAGSSQAVVDFLQDNGFDIPSTLDGLLAPYVTESGRFLAVRLSKDADTGDIAPLGFRYPGDHASIPIQLTAVAATDDMGVQVAVFGEELAVPTNYLHIQPDLTHVDFADGGQDYYDVLARAVDEAGGHAFATDYAGVARGSNRIWSDDNEAILAELATLDDDQDWLQALARLQIPANNTAAHGFEGFQDIYFYVTNPVGPVTEPFDRAVLLDQLEERLFPSLRRTQAVLDQPQLTRMVTTLSPAEMTLDPMFALNPDRPPVNNLHRQITTRDCDAEEAWVTLDDERVPFLPLPDRPYNLRIETYDASGPPEVLVDNPRPSGDAVEITPFRPSSAQCSNASKLTGLWLLVGSLLALSRRREDPVPS